jgi:hypothetical protein
VLEDNYQDFIVDALRSPAAERFGNVFEVKTFDAPPELSPAETPPIQPRHVLKPRLPRSATK